MSDLGEIGESLGEVFGPQAETLAATVQDATDQLGAMQAQFEDTVGTDGGPALEQLRARFEVIALTLGSLAADVGEIQVAGRSYLTRIGFEADADFAPPVAAHQPVSRATPERRPIDPLLTAKLSTGLVSLMGDDADPAMQRCVNSAGRGGVLSVHDALLLGASGLEALHDLGPKGVRNLKTMIDSFCPETPLADGPDPAVAAQICNSLDEVPIDVLKGHQDFRRKLDRVTVQDVLTRPADELFRGAPGIDEEWNDDKELSSWQISWFNVLHQRARDYAVKFEAAKAQQP